MAKSSAERKADQRARQSAAGEQKVELILDSQELEMLDYDCTHRRPGRSPYSREELISMMIRKYHAELLALEQELGARQCGKCGDLLPVQDCPCKGEVACWARHGWHETKLVI